MHRILFLIPTRTYRAAAFLDAARRFGAEVVVASEEPSALESAAPHKLLTLDFDRPEAAARRAVEFAAKRPLDAVLAVDDRSAVVAALIAARLGLSANPPEAVSAASDKPRMRELFKAAGMPSPVFRVLDASGDPAAAGWARFPCVLKPARLAASRGVIRADDPEGFVAAFRRIAALLKRPDVAGDCAGDRRILVEDFIPGAEVALEGILEGGRLRTLAVFDKPDPLDGPYFEETIYVTPSRLGSQVLSRVSAAAQDAARALGLREGPLHAELRITAGGECRLIEAAARTIGGLCSRALRFGAGFSLEDLVLRHALKLDLSFFERERLAGGVMMLPIPRAGVFRGLRGTQAARKVPGIVDLVVTAVPGRRLEPLPEGGEYLGFLFAQAATPAAVERALRKAHKRLRVLYDSRVNADKTGARRRRRVGAPTRSRTETEPRRGA